ncbi:AraC family transcriptional regulator [Sphingomonas glacialis]|uniref:AraC family transcriptional regulator n=1 Tax=Sphingomonas glacialis TaxID=658225 RepID=A0A502FSE8_9SPHN|nr:AraC family transcriptional regulator [Sphingomonas glacialis]TPG52066.1 AraC family transcriptional regulator [Sphingomonas glacialis]
MQRMESSVHARHIHFSTRVAPPSSLSGHPVVRPAAPGQQVATPITIDQTSKRAIAALLARARTALDGDVSEARECLDRMAQMMEIIPPVPTSVDLSHSIPSSRAETGGLPLWQVRRVRAFVDANLAETVSIGQLARLVDLSSSHFSRAFKRSTGDTPYEFIMRRRAERARILMLGTSDSLSQIARKCGFADQAHLTRLFKRFLGQTPMRWKRAHVDPDQASRTP